MQLYDASVSSYLLRCSVIALDCCCEAPILQPRCVEVVSRGAHATSRLAWTLRTVVQLRSLGCNLSPFGCVLSGRWLSQRRFDRPPRLRHPHVDLHDKARADRSARKIPMEVRQIG